MTVTLTATDCYQVVRCAPRGRPRRLPPGWGATRFGVDGRTRHATWVLYDPATHNVANVIGAPPAALRRQLLNAGCQPLTTNRPHSVYLVSRDIAASILAASPPAAVRTLRRVPRAPSPDAGAPRQVGAAAASTITHLSATRGLRGMSAALHDAKDAYVD